MNAKPRNRQRPIPQVFLTPFGAERPYRSHAFYRQPESKTRTLMKKWKQWLPPAVLGSGVLYLVIRALTHFAIMDKFTEFVFVLAVAVILILVAYYMLNFPNKNDGSRLR